MSADQALSQPATSRSGPSVDLIRELQAGNCVLCAITDTEIDRFYFWFLSENYSDPAVISLLIKAQGFCRDHGQQVLELSPPSIVAHVYSQVCSGALQQVRQAEHILNRRQRGRTPTQPLRATAECHACMALRQSLNLRLNRLQQEIEHPQVLAEVQRGYPLCVDHLVRMLPTLNSHRSLFLERTIALLENQGPANPDLITALYARPGYQAKIDRATTTELISSGIPNWSASLSQLHALMESENCPVCTSVHIYMTAYWTWLEQEVVSSPVHQWWDALNLCTRHAWDFQHRAAPVAAASLFAQTRLHWIDRLTMAQPRVARRDRLPGWINQLAIRSGASSAISCDLQPGAQCPACRATAEAARRACRLLATNLDSPPTAGAYHASSGVCLPHLRVLLGQCETQGQIQIALTVARTRLSTIYWELAELGRLQSWSTRWEPKSITGIVCRRAVQHMAGL